MSMEDIMKALMQPTSGQGQQQQQASQGSDALSQVLGGLLGGAQQGGGQQAGGAGGMLAQALGGLLGGGQQAQQSGGAAGVGQLLGGLQQIIGGTPGTGQQLPMGGGNMSMGAASPVMMLLQPVVTQLAEKAGLSPQIAMVVASIAVHYLVQSHPNTPGASPMNLGNVMQTLSSGGRLDQKTLQSSGIVDDVMHATGMDQNKAVKTLNTTFDVLGRQIPAAKGKAASKTTGKKK
jgi:hypothetical protein